MVINLTEDDKDIIPDSEEGLVRDYVAEEKQQAANEEEETIQAKIDWAAADPAPECIPLHEDPPGIDNLFVSE